MENKQKLFQKKDLVFAFMNFFGQDFLNFFGPTVDFEDFFVAMFTM